MTWRRLTVAAFLTIAFLAGVADDLRATRPPLVLGGYQVMAADFHTHSSMWSNGTYTPFGLVLEARRRRLEALAITGHNEVLDAKLGRWFSSLIDGPVVLVGDEVQTLGSHLIAVGIEHAINPRLSVREQIADVHRQGGAAIAAHPHREFWPSFEDGAMPGLDGSEVCHPDVYYKRGSQAEFETFFARAPKTAIGSSDFHGNGPMGECRTYVFARERTAASIVEALREGRTVVYGPLGKAYGDSALIASANARPELRAEAARDVVTGAGYWMAFAAGLLGLTGLFFFSGPTAGPDTSSRSKASK